MKQHTNNFWAYSFQITAVLLLFGYGPLPAKEKPPVAMSKTRSKMPVENSRLSVTHPFRLLFTATILSSY
jgi:hypothetical protein